MRGLDIKGTIIKGNASYIKKFCHKLIKTIIIFNILNCVISHFIHRKSLELFFLLKTQNNNAK